MENVLYKFIPIFYFPQVMWLIPDISRLLSHFRLTQGGIRAIGAQNPKV